MHELKQRVRLSVEHVSVNSRYTLTLKSDIFLDWMNELQHISEKDYGPVLVTLNPPNQPRKELVAGSYKYDHPVLDSAVRDISLCSIFVPTLMLLEILGYPRAE